MLCYAMLCVECVFGAFLVYVKRGFFSEGCFDMKVCLNVRVVWMMIFIVVLFYFFIFCESEVE